MQHLLNIFKMESFNKKAIIYFHQVDNKINGTLFYCAEYFLELRKHLTKNEINFYIINLNDKDKKIIEEVFRDKYQLTINFIQIKVTQMRGLNLDKILVLDINTLIKIKDFYRGNIIAFSNKAHNIKQKNIVFYGSYHYQNYKHDCILKLGLDNHREVMNGSLTFISCPNKGLADLKWNTKIKKDYIFKDLNIPHIGLFDKIDLIIYVHVGLDTNNRIIIESFYHNKEIIIQESTNIKDSVQERYNDCLKGNLNKYLLNENDLMIQAMLKDTHE